MVIPKRLYLFLKTKPMILKTSDAIANNAMSIMASSDASAIKSIKANRNIVKYPINPSNPQIFFWLTFESDILATEVTFVLTSVFV